MRPPTSPTTASISSQRSASANQLSRAARKAGAARELAGPAGEQRPERASSARAAGDGIEVPGREPVDEPARRDEAGRRRVGRCRRLRNAHGGSSLA